MTAAGCPYCIVLHCLQVIEANAWVWLASVKEIAAAFSALVSRLTCRGSVTAISGESSLVSFAPFAPGLLKVLLSQSLTNGRPSKRKR